MPIGCKENPELEHPWVGKPMDSPSTSENGQILNQIKKNRGRNLIRENVIGPGEKIPLIFKHADIKKLFESGSRVVKTMMFQSH